MPSAIVAALNYSTISCGPSGPIATSQTCIVRMGSEWYSTSSIRKYVNSENSQKVTC